MEMRCDLPDEQAMSSMALHILLADDEPAILDVLGSRLLRAGFKVLYARDGRAALQIARQRIPALVVLDETMPAMRGLEVCARLAEGQATAKIPMILLTGLPIQSDVPPNIRKIVAKPFSTKTILEIIQEILARPGGD